jgi:hypothetical protein
VLHYTLVSAVPIGPRPAVSIILVSDYAAGESKSWAGIRASLAALSRQDFDEPAEFLLFESERFRDQIPPDLNSIVLSLQVHFLPDDSANALKNAAVRAASAEFVAILDADCIPDPSWLRLFTNALRAHPQAAAVSGRTIYAQQSFSVRVCALLTRSYVNPGHAGPTRFIAINNCAFRRTAFESHPLPTTIGPFTSRIQSEALLRDGWELRFEPDVLVTHAFEGWRMESDLRRSAGHGTIITRLRDPTLPWAKLARLGPLSIPLILAGKIFSSWGDCVRCGRFYGVRWFQLPAAMLMSVGVHLLEFPGMWRAYQGGGLKESSFR